MFSKHFEGSYNLEMSGNIREFSLNSGETFGAFKVGGKVRKFVKERVKCIKFTTIVLNYLMKYPCRDLDRIFFVAVIYHKKVFLFETLPKFFFIGMEIFRFLITI